MVALDSTLITVLGMRMVGPRLAKTTANISKQSQRSKSITKHQNGTNGDTVSSPVHESEVHVLWQVRSIGLIKSSRNIMIPLSVIVHSGAVAHIPSQHFIHDGVHTNRANYTSPSTRCLHSARKIENFNRWILEQLKWGGRDNFFILFFSKDLEIGSEHFFTKTSKCQNSIRRVHRTKNLFGVA